MAFIQHRGIHYSSRMSYMNPVTIVVSMNLIDLVVSVRSMCGQWVVSMVSVQYAHNGLVISSDGENKRGWLVRHMVSMNLIDLQTDLLDDPTRHNVCGQCVVSIQYASNNGSCDQRRWRENEQDDRSRQHGQYEFDGLAVQKNDVSWVAVDESRLDCRDERLLNRLCDTTQQSNCSGRNQLFLEETGIQKVHGGLA